MILRRLAVLSTTLMFTSATFAQSLPTQLPKKGEKAPVKPAKEKNAPAKPTLDTQQSFKIHYGSTSWNTDSRQIESANLLVRDADSGKMAQILLEETAPDSSVFSGDFSLTWGTEKKITPEIYIPPQNLRDRKNWLEVAGDMIEKGQMQRKPFLFKREQRTLEVFDTATQAKAALKTYREEVALKKSQDLKRSPKDTEPIAAKAALEAAQLAAAEALKQKLALEAAQREAERIRLAQIEAQKEAERLRKQSELDARQRAIRRAQAKKIAEQAMAAYRAGDFKQAANLFAQSIELDPSEKIYYFQYGVALYKIEDFNKSIVILKSADSKAVNEAEKNYYLGLNYFRLQENEAALDVFDRVKKSQHPELGPSAAFYKGLIQFQTHHYEEAKPEFEHVLDTSKDPKLDERAEAYIEQIAGILYFAAQKKIKFFLSGTFGLQYDSNVLLVSNETGAQDTATDQGGLRMLGVGSGKWRPVYSAHHEFATQLDLVYYYSFNEDFNAADPFLVTLKTPYTYKDTVWKKGYKLDVTPGYELLFMDVENTGTRDQILASILLDVDNTFIMRDDWYSTYTVDLRLDDSSLEVSDEADDSSATKVTLSTSQMFFLNKPKSKILIGDFGATINSADGDNNKYLKLLLGTTYVHPLTFWGSDLSWASTLTYYNQGYSERADDRKDGNITVSSSLSRKINDYFSVSVTADYSKNSSNVDTFSYNKFSVMTAVSSNYSF